jgi:hypothetical protein
MTNQERFWNSNHLHQPSWVEKVGMWCAWAIPSYVEDDNLTFQFKIIKNIKILNVKISKFLFQLNFLETLINDVLLGDMRNKDIDSA